MVSSNSIFAAPDTHPPTVTEDGTDNVDDRIAGTPPDPQPGDGPSPLTPGLTCSPSLWRGGELTIGFVGPNAVVFAIHTITGKLAREFPDEDLVEGEDGSVCVTWTPKLATGLYVVSVPGTAHRAMLAAMR